MIQKIPFLLLLFLTACAQHPPEGGNVSSEIAIKNVKGLSIYQQNCMACHGIDGTGVFASIPDLTKVKGFKDSDQAHAEYRHIEHVKNGIKRLGSAMAMPPKGGNPDLSDQDIKDVLEYMHEKFSSQ